jgi:hypothetical protein
MAANGFDGVFYVDRPPTIRFEDGLFHVCYTIGRDKFEIVMRPSIFAKAGILADEVRAKWQLHTLDSANVTRIRKKR